jgi:N utilization substance protein A
LSLAIGRAGVNARLGAKLTNWRIDIKSLVEAASESLLRLQSDVDLKDLAKTEDEILPQIENILLKKEETRPVTPEEYQILTSFIQRVQGEIVSRQEAIRQAYREQLAEIREHIPSTAYDVDLAELDLSTRVLNLMKEAGFETAGRVYEQLELDKNVILELPGVGPKAVEELTEKVMNYTYPEPEVEPEPEIIEEPAEVEEVLEVVDVEEVEAEVEVEAPDEPTPLEAPPAEIAEPEISEDEAPVQTMEEALESMADVLDVDLVEAGEEEALEEPEKKETKVQTRYLEYDPETGEMVVHRRRKPGRAADWEDQDGYDDF